MAETAFDKLTLSGLARATQASLDWRNWAPGARRSELEEDELTAERLNKLIELEIIPRLMLVSRDTGADAAAPVQADTPARAFTADEVDRFARRAVDGDPDALVDEVNRRIAAGGVSHEDVLLKLLAPAARRLGRLWDEDLVDFADVTIGLMKLHRVLERINAETPCGLGAGRTAPRILLAPAPGEQHVFGVVMVGEFFAKSGWRVRCETAPCDDDLVAAAAADHYDVVGLSVSAELNMKTLRAAIRKVRAASRNRDVSILVGGQVFNGEPGLARRVGADATATDGVRAVVTAERMVHRHMTTE
ncbi:MAG: cobalamin B12-binding domain-containing protein [Oceanicaulis sp.]